MIATFLASRFGLAAVLGIALAVVFGLWQIQVANIRAESAFLIGQEQKATRDTKAAWDAYNLQVEQQNTDNATIRAREADAQLAKERGLQSEIDRLRGLHAQEKENREIVEAENLRILNNAPRDQDSLLDARTRAYYRSLRERQTAAAAASDQATRGSPN